VFVFVLCVRGGVTGRGGGPLGLMADCYDFKQCVCVCVCA
jgi:hypothetical protein